MPPSNDTRLAQAELDREHIAGLQLDLAAREPLKTVARRLELVAARRQVQKAKDSVARAGRRNAPPGRQILQNHADAAQPQAAFGANNSFDGRGGAGGLPRDALALAVDGSAHEQDQEKHRRAALQQQDPLYNNRFERGYSIGSMAPAITAGVPAPRKRKTSTTRPIMHARNTLCRSVNRNRRASSSGFIPVAATATARLDRLIILPITPPLEFADAIRTGLRPRRFAVMTCKFPNSALEEVSDPVRKTPSQPRIAPKNGNDAPVAANASPRVPVAPRIIHQVGQAEHRGQRHQRQFELPHRVGEDFQEPAGRDPQHEGRQKAGDQAGRSRRREPVEIEHRRVRRNLGGHRRDARDLIVQARPLNRDAHRIQRPLHRLPAPQQHARHQQQVRTPRQKDLAARVANRRTGLIGRRLPGRRLRLPYQEQQNQRCDRRQRRDEVGELGSDEIRDQELHAGE